MGRTRQDYYELLGVPRTADDEAIRKAFHALARRFHPDVSSDPNAEEKFREVATAYEVLSRPRSRVLYDHLSRSRGGRGERRAPAAGNKLAGPAASYPTLRATQRRRPRDVKVELAVDALTARRGSTRNFGVTIRRPCEECGGLGAGSWDSTDPCAACLGTGTRTVERAVRVRLAPGTADGDNIRVPAEGDVDRTDGTRGDVVVAVRVVPAPDLPLVRYASLAGLAVALAFLVVVFVLL